MPATHLLAIDQGTTSTRAILFDREGRILAVSRRAITQHYPQPGWVEHDPEEIWQSVVTVCREALAVAKVTAANVAAVGITNQRETTIVWDRKTGIPIHRAIVWQDRRTADYCRRLTAEGLAGAVSARTGLVLDPYFSGTKIAWLLDNLPDARRRAEQGELAFGTVDSFIIWRLTGGKVHATDASNASRTLLYDIHRNAWDKELCGAVGVPMAMLPEVRDSAGDFGDCDASVMGRAIPIAGVAGDQQAATIGQACIEPGLVKSTYGTGTFALMNTGNRAVPSRNRLLTVLAWRLKGQTTYALEGSVFVSGATVQWLRDTVKLLPSAGESEQIATSIPDNRGVYLVPAFVGLGAPYWDPDARAAIFGMTRDTGPAEIIRAGLEAAAYSTRDLLDAMAADAATVGLAPKELRVDGGMAENAWLMQFLADIVGLPVDRPQVTETTALGAAALAGLGVGLLPRLTAVAAFRHPDKRWAPSMAAERSARLFAGWQTAVRRVLTR